MAKVINITNCTIDGRVRLGSFATPSLSGQIDTSTIRGHGLDFNCIYLGNNTNFTVIDNTIGVAGLSHTYGILANGDLTQSGNTFVNCITDVEVS
jgi:hypothetical protein